jgi:hypothetical protein
MPPGLSGSQYIAGRFVNPGSPRQLKIREKCRYGSAGAGLVLFMILCISAICMDDQKKQGAIVKSGGVFV